MKTILASATGGESDAPVFQAALDVARLFSGHIDFLHAKRSAGDLAADMAIGGEAELSVGIIEKLEEQSAELEEKARGAFDRFVEREGLAGGGAGGAAVAGKPAVTVAWCRELGRAEDWLPQYARTSDLAVVGRPIRGDTASRLALEAALFASGRPILIPAPSRIATDTLAIAWKSTREAARAVNAAMPFVAKAKRLVVLVATEQGTDDAASAARLVATLGRHHAKVELDRAKPERRHAAEALLARAGALGAGLLVMGGYGHSRLREWVFGGVTEQVLRGSPLPVLMAH